MTAKNIELRRTIAAMRKKSPHRSAADMARELGITRERVRQILKELGLPGVVRYTPPESADR